MSQTELLIFLPKLPPRPPTGQKLGSSSLKENGDSSRLGARRFKVCHFQCPEAGAITSLVIISFTHMNEVLLPCLPLWT